MGPEQKPGHRLGMCEGFKSSGSVSCSESEALTEGAREGFSELSSDSEACYSVTAESDQRIGMVAPGTPGLLGALLLPLGALVWEDRRHLLKKKKKVSLFAPNAAHNSFFVQPGMAGGRGFLRKDGGVGWSQAPRSRCGPLALGSSSLLLGITQRV